MNLKKIISGGQTGADRGALDAALEYGFPCGGWCPEGRKAEDGPLPGRYPLMVSPGAGYRQRTIRNLRDADATAIFYFGQPLGGTELTLGKCIQLHRPYQLIDGSEVQAERAAEILFAFIEREGVTVLNVAGPRESSAPNTYAYVFEAMQHLLRLVTASHSAGGPGNNRKSE